METLRVLTVLVVWLTVLVGGAAVIMASAPAAAAEEPGGNVSAAPTGERIDQDTVLVDASYNPQTERATVTIHSYAQQEITVTDGGALLEGGEMDQTSVVVGAGETANISVSATQVNGQVAVSVATAHTLYGVPIQPPDALFYEDPTWSTVRIGSFGSGFGVLVALGLEVARRKWYGKRSVRALS